MSTQRETEKLKTVRTEITSVDERRADSASEIATLQFSDGVFPWQGDTRRLFGKRPLGHLTGAAGNQLACITIYPLSPGRVLYQTREGIIINAEFYEFPVIPSLTARWRAGSLTLNDNDPVTSFTDISGNARHLTAGGSFRPLMKKAAFSGKDCIRFDGLNDQLSGFTTGNFINSFSGTIIVVFRASLLPTNNVPLYNNTSLFTDAGAYLGVSFLSTGNMVGYSYDVNLDSVTLPYTVNTIAVAVWQINGVDLSFAKSSNLFSTTPTGNVGSTANLFKLGTSWDNTRFFQGDIAEMVTFNATLTPLEIQSILQYFYQEYHY